MRLSHANSETRPLRWWQRILVYAAAGWCIELFFAGIGDSIFSGDPTLAGKTYLWMLPIWGLGALFLEYVSAFLRLLRIGTRVRIIVFMLLCFSLEYVSGFMIQSLVDVIPWDYAGASWSVDGLIRLDYAPFWALSGMFLEPFIDFIKRVELRYEKKEEAISYIRPGRDLDSQQESDVPGDVGGSQGTFG